MSQQLTELMATINRRFDAVESKIEALTIRQVKIEEFLEKSSPYALD